VDEKLGSFEKSWKTRGSSWIRCVRAFFLPGPSFFFLFKDLEKKKKKKGRRRQKFPERKPVEKRGQFVDFGGVFVDAIPSRINDLAKNRPEIHGFFVLPVPRQRKRGGLASGRPGQRRRIPSRKTYTNIAPTLHHLATCGNLV
jgi:hypothetical protein